MCNPQIDAWMKFIMKDGSVFVGRVTNVTATSITIDNEEPTAGGYHKSFTFPKMQVSSCSLTDDRTYQD